MKFRNELRVGQGVCDDIQNQNTIGREGLKLQVKLRIIKDNICSTSVQEKAKLTVDKFKANKRQCGKSFGTIIVFSPRLFKNSHETTTEARPGFTVPESSFISCVY